MVLKKLTFLKFKLFLMFFNMFAINRNSYLQSQCSSVNPRIINRSVDQARDFLVEGDCSYLEPPLFRLSSEQPDIPKENADATRSAVAFGNWALPKLTREIHDEEDDLTIIQALRSIGELVHNPEYAYPALANRIPDRLLDTLVDPLPPVREKAVLILKILAQYHYGKEAIVANEGLLNNLIRCLSDEHIAVRHKTAACLEMMARSWMVADVLVDRDLIMILLEIIEKDEVHEIVEFHLDTLKSLMYDCGKCIAIKLNGFSILINLLEHDECAVVCKALDCLSIIVSTRKGKLLAIQTHLLNVLTKLIHYGNTQIITSATSVLMFCTVKTRAKHLAAEIKSLPKRLVKLVNSPLNVTLQMFALKVLTNICEHPTIRNEVKERYWEDLDKMQVAEANREYKTTLIKVISWDPKNYV